MNIQTTVLLHIFYYPGLADQRPMFSKPEKLKCKKFHNNPQSGKLTIWKQVALLRPASCGSPGEPLPPIVSNTLETLEL